MSNERSQELSNQNVKQNPELVYLDKKKVALEQEKQEELSNFLVEISDIYNSKGKSDKNGYIIRKSWGGKAVKKQDLETVGFIEKKYEDELRKIEQRIDEINQLNGDNLQEDDKTDYEHDQKNKKRELVRSSSKLINLITQVAKNSQDKLKNNPPAETKISTNIESSKKNEKEITIEELAVILKNNKINEIIVAGSYDQEKKWVRFDPDLDSRGALYLLNNLNKKKTEETYAEGAKTTMISKKGYGREIIEKESSPGIRIFLDTGGEWLKVVENDDIKTIYIDHHGSGKKDSTSGTKMIYRAMKEAGILEDKPWVKRLVRFINDTDNLSYVDEKDKFEKKVFTETNFKNNWPRSLYALAEDYIPFDKLIELFEKDIIKDPSKPLTKEELDGEIGKIEVINFLGEKKSLREMVKEIENKTVEVVDSIKRARNFQKEEKLNLDSKNLGKIIYHNFKCKYKDKEGKINTNIIDDKMAFKAIKAMNAETYVVWNNAKNKKTFCINSTNADLVELTKRLNEADPGCAKEVRGVFVFGKINNLTEEQFLDILDPEILKNSKRKNRVREEKIKTNKEIEKPEGNDNISVENEKQIQKEEMIEKLKDEIDRLIKERDEKIEAIRVKYKNTQI